MVGAEVLLNGSHHCLKVPLGPGCGPAERTEQQTDGR
jgi:hypothetical protein